MSELPGPIAETVLRVARRLGASPTVEQLFSDLLDEVLIGMRPEVGAIYRWDDDRALLIRVSATTPPPDSGVAVRLGEGLVGEAAARWGVRTVIGDPDVMTSVDGSSDGRPRSLLAMPLVYRDRTCGVLVVGRRADRPSPEDDIALLDALASLAAPIVALAQAVETAAVLRDRIDALTRAARTLAHDLNNDLTMPVGALELLGDRPDLPAGALELVMAAADDLARIESRVRAFQLVARDTP